MQDIKQQLQNVGLSVTLKIVETGQMVNLEFGRGETRKPVVLSLGPVQTEGFLTLVEIPSKGVERPNLALALVTSLRPQVEAIVETIAPKVEVPVPPAPKAPEPKVEEPKPEEPKVEQPKVEEPKPEEPKVEQPKTEELPPPAVDIPVETEKTESVPLTETPKKKR